MKTLPRKSTGHLKAIVEGEVIPPGDAGYDDVRRIWNARVDQRLEILRLFIPGPFALGGIR